MYLLSNKEVSSAYWEIFVPPLHPGVWIPLIFLLLPIVLARVSATKIYNNVDKGHPWRTPRSISIIVDKNPRCFIWDVKFLYIIRIHFIKFYPKLKCLRTLKRKLWSTLSKAFSWSIEKINPLIFFSFVYCIISLKRSVFALIERPGTPQVCDGWRISFRTFSTYWLLFWLIKH